MTAPLNQFATSAYAYLEPVAQDDAANGYVLQTLCGAIGSMFDQVEQVARAQPGREPYQQVYDINQCPGFMLGWLGQFVGVPWTPYTDMVAKRQQVRDEIGFYRGTVSNEVAAGESTQTAPGHIVVYERYTGDAWQQAFAYDPAYTPDATAFANAVRAAVPWGIKVTVNSASIPLFGEGTLIPDTLSSSIHFDTATLADIT